MTTFISNSATIMKFSLGLQICVMCILWAAKHAKRFLFSKKFYICRPSISVLRHTEKTGLIVGTCRSHVLHVDARRDIPQIANSIICWVRINMVNLVCWPLSVPMKPSQPMRVIGNSINSNEPSSVLPDRPCNVARFAAFNTLLSSEFASVRIVVKKFTDALCGKIGLSHAVSPVKKWCGQRPRSVSALSGLRYFISGVSV